MLKYSKIVKAIKGLFVLKVQLRNRKALSRRRELLSELKRLKAMENAMGYKKISKDNSN